MRSRWSAGGAGLTVALLLAATPGPGDALRTLRATSDAVVVTDPLVAAAGLLAWLLAGWLLLTVALTGGSRVGGPLGAACAAALRHAAPATVRHAVALALGLGVALGSAGTASAASPLPRPPSTAGSAALDWPVAVPGAHQRGAAVSTPDAAPATPGLDWPAPARSAAAAVVVEPGDTLWDLAAERLPRAATDAQIAAAWPSWWSANRQVIGDDPDLLHPGQRLRPPHGTGPGPA